ncbi:hypothetical protein H2201_004626 [Coniosporium apollinis]|uniref:CCR4-NOT transcription complex subunit 11 n=1 Tax=Coniosporium apollinis TaxID=61459 RepID=A0ABQ9NSF5_9PEZI|nr:hypothetical protein H2201_004626 [Coniosporium apollinis]
MDVTATLPPELVAIVSNYKPTLGETTKIFEGARQAERAHAVGVSPFEAVFQDSLKLKNKLDELEAYDPATPDLDLQSLLAAVLNCEYQLYKLNAATPLRHNPFLSHWVEVITGWKEPIQPAVPPGGDWREHSTRFSRWTQVFKTRVELVKAILKQDDVERLRHHTPASLLVHFRSSPVRDFCIEPHIRMLEEEGIYEKPPQPQSADSVALPGAIGPASASTSGPDPSCPPITSTSLQDSLLQRLHTSPADVLHTLTRLPITLESLELLNTVLTSQDAYQALDTKPADLVREYLQRSLRRVERADNARQQPLTAQSHSSLPSASTSATNDDEGGADELLDREAQIRAIKLLVLFIRNLIRKGVVGPEEIFFEIREICVRYIWIREVREFRAWVEEGRDAGGER